MKANSESEQKKKWVGDFGESYTRRNIFTCEEYDAAVKKNLGVSKTEMYQDLLGDLNRSAVILEVGANVGNQLVLMQRMGFFNLYGIELSQNSVELAKCYTRNINIIKGDAMDIPFKAGFFDLVFTSGLLINICPKDVRKVMTEIHRCTNKYILGYEYYSEKLIEKEWRGESNMLWKDDYCRKYISLFEDLEIIKENKYSHLDDKELIDTIFLLSKKN